MAEHATTARPYARAVFESAQASNALADWSAFLAAAAAAVADARVAALIGNPHVESTALVDFLFELSGRTDRGGREYALLQLLADNGRLDLLPEIAAQYAALRAEAEGQADVEVISAQALTAEQEQTLAAALAQRLARRVRLHVQVDPQLIGGAVVRYGDFVVDGSLRGRIDRMAAAMGSA
jgi:F-type H+-transporting ATPase subunit delta